MRNVYTYMSTDLYYIVITTDGTGEIVKTVEDTEKDENAV